MIWTLHYQETRGGPWIAPVLRGNDPDEVWKQWSRPWRVPVDYYAAMVVPL